MTTKTIANGDRHSMIEYGPLSLSLTSRPSPRSDF